MPDTYYVPMDYLRTNSLLYTNTKKGERRMSKRKSFEKRYMANEKGKTMNECKCIDRLS